MKWNVYREDFNKKEIVIYDIFTHGSFLKDLEELKAGTGYYSDLPFEEGLRRILAYYFWSKSEHEVVITSWPPRVTEDELARLETNFEQYENDWGRRPYSMDVRPTVGSKIDIYDQVRLNWDVFVKYVKEKLNV